MIALQGSFETAYRILYNEELVERNIENIVTILKAKGFYGLNVTFQFLSNATLQVYNNYVRKLSSRLNSEGFFVMITIVPRILFNIDKIAIEQIDYSVIGEKANGVTLMNFNWGYSYGPPGPSTNIFWERQFIEYACTVIPREKLFMGIPVTGYDWLLPYEIGVTRANSLTTASAIALAAEYGATIHFDEYTQSPYFEYTEIISGIPRQHVVWFKNASSIKAILNLVPEYGLQGVGIWNIMQYFPELWLGINSQFEIKKVL